MKSLKIILSMLFAATLLSCASTNGKTLFIAAETKPCTGVAPMECMLVKTDRTQAEWQFFYSNIEGFNYEKGYEYELLVKETKIENPPADGSSIRYSLVKVVSKVAKK